MVLAEFLTNWLLGTYHPALYLDTRLNPDLVPFQEAILEYDVQIHAHTTSI